MTWPELHATLNGRATCEQVAGILLTTGHLSPLARHEAARVAHTRPAWYVTSMSEDFDRAEPDLRPQLAAAAAISGTSADDVDPDSPESIRRWVDVTGLLAGGWTSASDWKADRKTRARLRELERVYARSGLITTCVASPRQRNRLCRVLRSLSQKADRMDGARVMRRLTLLGRSGFAADIPLERFAADPRAAAFIAYYVARRNRRRMFTLDGRDNPIDNLAKLLLAACVRRGKYTDWEMIAYAWPVPKVLARLTDAQRGELLGRWWQFMSDLSGKLAAAFPAEVHRETMIVRRGMDSSTWNTLAGAYNAARAAWLNCLASSGALPLLEPFCPGKAMRLMAADLAWWHQASGGHVEPNTWVWATLPLPWDVIHGLEECTATRVRAACEAAGLDPAKSGWTAPRATGRVAAFVPTPELVHGVAVASPQWAGLLRSAGVFAGPSKPHADDAGELRAMADQAGVITGRLPVKDTITGKYLGSTGPDN